MRYLVGIGNYSGYDDSIGLRVAEAVAERGLECGFQAIDLGGNLVDLVHYLDESTETVLIVDSAYMGCSPGEFALFVPEQVTSRKTLAGVSTHEGDLMKVLGLAASLGQPLPAVTILGIEPQAIRTEIGLSPALQERFDEYIDAVLGFFGGA